MAGSRRRKKNRRSRAGFILTLLFAVIIAAGGMAFFKYRGTILDDGETIAEVPAERPAAETEIPEETEAAPVMTVIAVEPETETEPETEPPVQYKPAITLAFAGDVLLDPSYAIMASMLQRGGDITTCFDEALLNIMRDSDVFMINNEFPYSERGEPVPEKQFTFRAKPEYAQKLNEIGVDIVTLANNHVNDYGQNAMLDTFDALDAAGIPYVGAGRNIDEAAAPYYMEVEGVRIAYVAATQIERSGNPDTVGATENSPGVLRCLNPDRFLEAIREAKENADIVIAVVHWGTENETEPDWMQLEQAPMIVEAGADVIIGAHPHVLQRIEEIAGVPVFYSLGNYLFNSKTLDTGIASIKIDTSTKKVVEYELIPALQSGCRTMIKGDTSW